jgi:5,10-methylenetetrahydromethanopterin reductase
MEKQMTKFGIGLVPEEGCELSIKHSIIAEEVGLNYVFMSDHLKGRNVHICLSGVAYNTKKILLGPGITNPYLIHPVTMAQILTSINEVIPGRVVCGIGAGDKSNLTRIGVKQDKPMSMVREAVHIIRTIANGRKLTLEGEKFNIKNERFSFPKAIHLPIFVGAQGDKMLRLAGEIGDGVIINAANPIECERAIEIVKKSGENKNRNMNNFEIAAAFPFSISRKIETTEKPLLPKVAVVAAGCSSKVLERLGISKEEGGNVRKAVITNNYDNIVNSVTPEMMESLTIFGTPEICIEKISNLIKVGVTLIVLAPPLGPKHEDSIRLVAREVIDNLNFGSE